MSPAPRLPWLCGAAVAVALVASPASAQRVGVSSAVNPATTGAPPGGAAKTLLVGENIVFNEHINTGPDGQTQVLFVDESAVSIGPNSDMTIDEFVYDPKTGTGTEALSATRGVFRYVGGKLSKGATPVTIKTAVATIGIRGGVFVMDLGSDGTLEVIFLYGNGLTITGLNGVTVTITRPGFGVTVNGRGAGPSNPTRVSGGKLASFINQLDGHSGGNGGASQVPTDTTVANSGVSGTVSGNLPSSVQQAIQTQGSQTQTQTQTVTPPAQNNLNTTGSQSQPSITQADNNTAPPNPTPNPTPQGGIAGGVVTINTANHQSGFTNRVVPYSGGAIDNGVFVGTIGGDSVNFSLSQGTGTITGGNQSQSVVGSPVVNADGSFFYSSLALVSDPSKVGFVYGGQPVASSVYTPNGTPRFYAFQIQPDTLLQSQIPFVTNNFGGQITTSPSVSPLFFLVPAGAGIANGQFVGTTPTALQASLAINGTGPSQSSALVVAVANTIVTNGNPGQTTPLPLLSGAAEGSFRPDGMTPSTRINTTFQTGVDGAGNSFYGNNAIEGFVLTPYTCCNTDGSQIPALATATNTLTNAISTYGFVQPAVLAATPAIANGPQAGPELTGFFGGTMVGTANGNPVPYAISGGAAIAFNPATSQVAAALAGSDPFTAQQSGLNSYVAYYGATTANGNTVHQGYINDNLFGALEAPGGAGSSVNSNAATNASLYLVDANAVPNNPLLPATGLCQCQYLQWGYWGGEIDSGTGANARTDIGHINTWVAGVQTPQADLNNLTSLSATANYLGNAIGTVNNNGASYLATGTFSETYHFGTSTGTLAINNFDGNTIAGTVRGASGLPGTVVTLSGNNLTGTGTALFFGPNAAETGGNFAVHSMTGLPYQAAGVFAGKKN